MSEPTPEYIIVGTAGHVDHGKTVLVKALTGINTDRLKEEQKRGISIELGFAPLVLKSGKRLGLVDVPGHERFIRQMVAGAMGMDLVMLIVAADEGVMPQTKEHLAILDLLGIKKGIVVLTKTDLVEEEWLDLVEEEVKEELRGTFLEGAPLVRVSAFTGQGIEELKETLEELASATTPKEVASPLRLPLDRIFSLSGFGTIVAGTLFGGVLKAEDEVEILPLKRRLRVRSLEVHGQKVKEAYAGQRVAVNLPGIEVSELKRGDVLVLPDTFIPTRRLAASMRLLEDAEVKENQRVRFYLGTAEVFGRLLPLEKKEIKGGEEFYGRLILEEPVVAVFGDHFILRRYSPLSTLGGGIITDPFARRKHLSLSLSLADLFLQKIEEHRFLTLKELALLAGTSVPRAKAELDKLLQSKKIEVLEAEGEEFYVAPSALKALTAKAEEILSSYHRLYPLRPGLSKEEFRFQLLANDKNKLRLFQALLKLWEREGLISSTAKEVALSSFAPQLSVSQQKALALIEEAFRANLFSPPSFEEIAFQLGLRKEEKEELFNYLLQQGLLIKVNTELVFHRQAVLKAQEIVAEMIAQKGAVELGEVRDKLNTSRKYVLPLLEYFDHIKFTRRSGEKRVLFKNIDTPSP